MTDLILTSTQQTEIYNALHNPAAYFTGSGHVLEQYFVGAGATRIQQAIQHQIDDILLAISYVNEALESMPTKQDLADAVTELKAYIDTKF